MLERSAGDSDLTTLRDANAAFLRWIDDATETNAYDFMLGHAEPLIDLCDRLVALLEARNEQNPGADKVGSESNVVFIARCPDHGLHGERTECFECGGPVEQVAMREVSE